MKKPPSLTAWSAAAWAILLPFLPPPAPRGRPRTQGWRGLLEARFSVVRRGGAGRLLPPCIAASADGRAFFPPVAACRDRGATPSGVACTSSGPTGPGAAAEGGGGDRQS